MTVICALHQDGETWIGSDQASAVNGGFIPAVVQKWALHGEWAMGHAGDGRMGDIIEHEKRALFDDLETPFDLMSRLREFFPKHGVDFKPRDQSDGSNVFPGSFLLANRHGVWSIGPCLCLTPISEGSLYARGSGAAEANGAGHALSEESAPRRVTAAIRAAIALDTICGGEPWIARVVS